jgi:serine/threonine protein kinase
MREAVAPGTLVSGYRIDAVVGRGGMGVVYEATQLSLQRTVALKLLSTELSDDPAFSARFRREGLLQAGLDHPHIIPVYEAGESDHGFFLAMRLVRGPNLKRLIAAGELSPVRALNILDQVAEALDGAHDAGLIHRDVKPQNILVAPRDHAYLADFGLTKAPDADSITQTGQFLGTLNYMAPEQIRGERSSPRTDVYSLGGVLFECVTGDVPFPRDSEAAVMYAQLQEPAPRVSELRDDVPAALDEVVGRALSKEPNRRQASASALLAQARRALGATAGVETLPAAVPATQDALEPTAYAGTHALPGSAPTLDGGSPDAAASSPYDPSSRLPGAPPLDGSVPSEETIAAAPPHSGRPRGRIALVAVATVVALAAAAAGLLLGRSSDAADASATTVAGPTVALDLPAGWRAGTPRIEIPGLWIRRPVGAVAGEGARSGLIAGEIAAEEPSMLPLTFRRTLRRIPAPERLRLGELEAYRYAGLRPKGMAGLLDLYLVPTTRGVATVACVAAPTDGAGVLGRCAQAAAGLRVHGARPFPVPPRGAFAVAVKGAMDTLIRKRDLLRDRLRYATTRDTQITATADLSGTYKTAARELARIRLSPPERSVMGRLIAGMYRARGGYVAMTRGAVIGDRLVFKRGSIEARFGEADVNRALDQFVRLGFRPA